MTRIIDFKNKIDSQELSLIGDAFRQGELVIFPTETVYGIGANALDDHAVESIFLAKGRAQDNPLIVHVSHFDMIAQLVEEPSELEKKLMDAFMPGPFTLILKKKEIIPDRVSCGLPTVGIRFPENEIARRIIEEAGVPIAAPSANISSRPSGTLVEDIQEEFDGKVTYIVDGGPSKIGVESTVCKVIDGVPTILRPGKITPEDIEAVVGMVRMDSHTYQKAEGPVESPGMKYKHYAPNTPCQMLYSDDEETFIELIKKHLVPNTVIIGCEEHKDLFDCTYYSYGSKDNLDAISHEIFTLLRKVDSIHASLILIEGVPKKGLGIAIMNRLIRSCSYNYEEVLKNE